MSDVLALFLVVFSAMSFVVMLINLIIILIDFQNKRK